jgi:ligand-binding sensor domain-containing protein/putative methionine-R-sulfoxide reductase with GAF domain
MNCLRLYVFILINIFCHPLWAQYESNNFHLYTSKDGLSNQYITGLAQDTWGYIWIATQRGLNRFDGNTFKQFLRTGEYNSIPDNSITSTQLLPGDELAIATNDGAQIISVKTLQTKTLEIPTEDALRYWSNSIQYVGKDKDGNYGVSTKTGYYIFSSEGKLKKRFDSYSVKDIGHSWMLFGRQIHLLPNGNMMQENNDGIYEYDRKNNVMLKISKDFPGLQQDIASFKKLRYRFFFISTYDLLILNNETNRFEIMDIRDGNKISFPSCINFDEEIGWQTKLSRLNDSTWALSSKNKGFYLLNIDTTNRTIACSPKKNFEQYFCNIVFIDNQKRLWVGTNEGLFMENQHRKIVQTFAIGSKVGGINIKIMSLYVAKDKILAGTDQNEVFVLDKQTGHIIRRVLFHPLIPGFKTVNTFQSFHQDTMWAGTDLGLMWLNIKNYSSGNVITFVPNEKMKEIRLMFTDKQKNIWMATGKINSLICYKPATRRFEVINDTTNPLLKINNANSFAEDNTGNIWIGGDAIARWSFRKQQIDTLIEHLPTQKNRKKGFTVMNDLNGDVWVVINDDGIVKITGANSPIHIRNENLVLDNSARVSPALVNDKIFLATNRNIGFLKTQDLKSVVFNNADGIPEQLITSRSFSFDSSDRSIWFACNDIICRIPWVEAAVFGPSPVLNITEVAVINDSIINYPPPVISLRYYQNDIRISLSAINFTDPVNMRFAYRIKNKKDTNWIETGTQQYILLTNISPGKYDLEVRLRAFDNKWPEQIKSMQLSILPPFWKTTWSIVTIALVILAAIYLFYKWRIAAIRKTEREKVQVQQLKAEEYKNRFELEQISNYFSSSLAGEKDIEDVLWDVAKNLIGHMGYVDCMIYLWNEDKTKMIQKAGFGPKGSPEAIASQVFDVVPGQGVVGYVIQTKEPVLISDTRHDKRYRMDEMFRLSEICVPIIHNGELLGIIDSEHHELNYYKERDLKILTTIATLVGDKIKQIESEKSLEIKQEELASINEQLAGAQLAALQTQMNPHFIFNALNSIKRMILDNEQQNASRYLSKFAQMIRLTLNHSKETFVTLQENIEYLHAYLEMEQLRFDDSFAYHIETNNNLDEEETSIPSLMIQPLVENAIWHGLMHKEGEKKIMISFYQNHDKVICTIEDNGIGINASEKLKSLNNKPHRSLGLENLRNRIKIINEKYDMNCTLDIIDRSENNGHQNGTVAVLKFKIINQ